MEDAELVFMYEREIKHRLWRLHVEEHAITITRERNAAVLRVEMVDPIGSRTLVMERGWSEWDDYHTNLASIGSWLDGIVSASRSAADEVRDKAFAQWIAR